MARSPIALDVLDGGAFWRLSLNAPKGNVLDSAMLAALQEAFERARTEQGLKGILLRGEGAHFSFGASVAEHMPDSCAAMLARLHATVRSMLTCDVFCCAAVRGQCLGAGLEIAALCQRVFAASDAKLGQPEIALGVFAPVGSLALRERLGPGAAEDLLLSGRSLDAAEAKTCGLVDALAEDPEAAALDYLRRYLGPKSASSLRYAVRAARTGFIERFDRELDQLERLYLDGLMRTKDAVEGLQAFLEKRAAQWRNA